MGPVALSNTFKAAQSRPPNFTLKDLKAQQENTKNRKKNHLETARARGQRGSFQPKMMFFWIFPVDVGSLGARLAQT